MSDLVYGSLFLALRDFLQFLEVVLQLRIGAVVAQEELVAEILDLLF